jgi:hypothetical protein
MPDTYIKIASNTVGSGGVASVTFSSIPATYTDLLIKTSARGEYAGVITDFGIAFNGGDRISDSQYSLITLYANSTTSASYTRAAFGYNHLFYIPAGSATANTFSNGEIYIPNYTSSNYKSVSVSGVNENNTMANAYNALTFGLRTNTAAITSITLSAYQDLAEHSTFTLYGISNA